MVQRLSPPLIRALIALVLFAAISGAYRFPAQAHIDRTITVAIQDTLPDVARPAAILAHLADAAVVIPALAVLGLTFLFFGDTRRGVAFLLLAIAAVGLSAIAAFFEHVIVDPGTPGALSFYVRRPRDTLGLAAVPIEEAVAFITLMAVSGFLYARLRNQGRRPVSLWPMVAAFVLCAAGLLLIKLVRGLPAGATARLTLTPFGYPSGHTTRTMLVAGTALRRIPAVGVAAVLAVALSLIYLGDHWVSEVLGGLCLGWVGAEIAWALWAQFGRREGKGSAHPSPRSVSSR